MQIVSFFPFFFFASPLSLFDSLFISNVFAVYLFAERVYALDKLQNTEGINHCHLAAQHVAHAARARVPCTSSEPAQSNFDEFQACSIHKSMRERRRGEGCGWSRQALLCFCNLSQIYVYTFRNEKSSGAMSVFIFPRPMAACLAAAPSTSRLLQQLFRWMIKVKAQPARVSPLLFKEEWDSCHLLMHCLPSRMQTRHPQSTNAFLRHSLPLLRVPKELPRVIDQVPWHHWRHVGSLPTQPARQKTLRHADLM